MAATAPERTPLYRVALVASIVALVAPILATRYLPFTDAPEHAAVMATLRHWNDPDFSGPYRLDLFRSQYVLYHLLGAGLTYVVGDANLANRLLVAAVGVGFPIAFAYLLGAAGRDRRLALFACLPFFSRALVVGFLPYVASVPILFVGIGLGFRQADAPTRRRAIGTAILATILFYVHVSAYLLFAAVYLAIAFLRPGWPVTRVNVARALRALGILFPSGVAALVWFSLGKLTAEGGSLSQAGEIGRMGLGRSLRALPMWMFDVWRSHGDEVAGAAWWLAFAILVVSAVRALGRYPRYPLLVLYVPFAITLADYLLTPYRVGAASMLNVRLSPVLALLALLPLRLPRTRITTGVLALVLGANLVGGITAFRECRRAAQDELGDVDAVLGAMPRGARVLSLHFDGGSTVTHITPWLHVGSYHRVRDGGIASFSFSELNHWPIHYKPEALPPRKPILWWELAPCLYRNAEDGVFHDFVLVRGTVDPYVDHPPGPVFREVVKGNAFTLYAKVPGETWPEWAVADEGPCVRRSAPL